MIASAANGGGTKITDAFAPVSFTASATVLKTGTSSASVRPCRASRRRRRLCRSRCDCCAWKVPSLPVNPCTIRRVFLIYQYAHRCPIAASFTTFSRRVLHSVGHREIEARFRQDLPAELHVGAFHADDDRHLDAEIARRRHHAGGQRVAAQDAAENIDQHRLHVLVAKAECETRSCTCSALAPPPTSRKFAGCRRRT